MAATPEQIAFWNGPAGERWVRLGPELDYSLGPLGDAAIDAVAPRAGEAVLDVGCGCGATTLTLAERVGPYGRVVGIDLSGPMLARARERIAERAGSGLAPVELVAGDASVAELAESAFDVVYSRFGVMFFDDPASAFAHLVHGLRPDGRLGFVCWRTLQENAWASLALTAVLPFLPPVPAEPPDAPGPFAFADSERVRRILAGAGLRDIVLAPLDTTIALGSGRDLASATDYTMQVGMVARRLAEVDDATRGSARAAIESALAPHVGPEGVRLGAACWIVTARR